MQEQFRGNYIGGGFKPAQGTARFRSVNPATEGTVVFEATVDEGAPAEAIAAARAAAPGWRRLGLAGRIEALRKVQACLPDHVDGIAEAIRLEMGKTKGEAFIEARSIAGKIDGTIAQLASVLPQAPPNAPGAQRFHPLGVVAIIGPFNFPVHLLHTHVVPTLLTGNTVVIKPSELTPLCGQRYAALFDAAGLPAGVFNMVHGLGATGAALVDGPVDGIVFTGSYGTGRRIRQATFDAPEKKVSLELGGKNPAVVLDDADLEQTVREIVLGALLTTGQRCTATSRVIAAPGIAPALLAALTEIFEKVRPGAPAAEGTLFGPLANVASRDRFMALLAEAREQGAQPVVESRLIEGGAYVSPSIYRVSGDEAFLREELFGPHLSFEVAADEDDCFTRAAANPYGLSASLFSARRGALERFYDVVRCGVINFNRSTNGASGLLPFGGAGMSGNWRPAGSAAPRLSTFPVAMLELEFGAKTPNAALDALLSDRNEAE